MQQILAFCFALLVLATGVALLAWLVAAGIWQAIDPLAATLFSLTAGFFWLMAASRLLGKPDARRHYWSAACLLAVVVALELGLILFTGHYTGVGMTLAVLGSSGGLVFTVIWALLKD